MKMKRVPKRPTPSVRKWVKNLRMALKARYIKPPSDAHVLKLAAFCTLVGQPGNDDADAVYWALLALFAHRRRRNRWAKAISEIPPDREKLLRLKRCVDAYRKHIEERTGVSFSNSNFKLDKVVKVMLEIPRPETYVRVCGEQGLYQVSAVFHPNTLRYKRKELRGVFGYGGEGEDDDYLNEVMDKLDVVD
jgi:hypothetical protein